MTCACACANVACSFDFVKWVHCINGFCRHCCCPVLLLLLPSAACCWALLLATTAAPLLVRRRCCCCCRCDCRFFLRIFVAAYIQVHPQPYRQGSIGITVQLRNLVVCRLALRRAPQRLSNSLRMALLAELALSPLFRARALPGARGVPLAAMTTMVQTPHP